MTQTVRSGSRANSQYETHSKSLRCTYRLFWWSPALKELTSCSVLLQGTASVRKLIRTPCVSTSSCTSGRRGASSSCRQHPKLGFAKASRLADKDETACVARTSAHQAARHASPIAHKVLSVRDKLRRGKGRVTSISKRRLGTFGIGPRCSWRGAARPA